MRGLLLSTVVLSFLFVTLNKAPAAVFRSSDKVIIAADETIDDDLYVFGGEIVIDGTVDGDVCAFGRQITINGTVTGNVMAAGQTVVIMGQTGGARIAGQVLKIDTSAKLDGDLLAAGFSLDCQKGSEVVGDALYAGYQALFAGKISSDLMAAMSNCRLEGEIGGDAKLEVNGDRNSRAPTNFGPPPPVEMPDVAGGLTITNAADLKGDLNYHSPAKAEIDPNAEIAGDVNFHQQLHVEKEGEEGKSAAGGMATAIFGRVRHILSVGFIGLVALLIFPRWTSAWADTIREKPVASFVGGLFGLALFMMFCVVMLIVIPLVTLILFGIRITELAPVVFFGSMVGYAGVLVSFWIVTMFLAEALVGMTIGRLAVQGLSISGRLGAMIIGVILLGIALSVPVLGWLIGAVVALMGLGSVCLWAIGQSPEQTASAPAGAVVPAVAV